MKKTFTVFVGVILGAVQYAGALVAAHCLVHFGGPDLLLILGHGVFVGFPLFMLMLRAGSFKESALRFGVALLSGFAALELIAVSGLALYMEKAMQLSSAESELTGALLLFFLLDTFAGSAVGLLMMFIKGRRKKHNTPPEDEKVYF